MPSNSIAGRGLEAVGEGLKKLGNEAVSEAKKTAGEGAAQLGFKSFLQAEGITALNDRQYIETQQRHGQTDTEKLDITRRELNMHADEGNSPVNIDAIQKAKAGEKIEAHAPAPPKKQTFSSLQHREMFQEVQGMGERMVAAERERTQQKAVQTAREDEIRQQTNAEKLPALEVPQGKQTGLKLKFNRKSNMAKGLSKLRVRSGETKAGFGKDT